MRHGAFVLLLGALVAALAAGARGRSLSAEPRRCVPCRRARLRGRPTARRRRARSCSAACACRGLPPACWSAPRSPAPAPPIRRCFAIRWCRPTFSASRPAPASARWSASCCRCRSPASRGWPLWAGSRPWRWSMLIAAALARPRPHAGAGARRRRGRRARRRLHLARQDPGRPLRPAAGDHLLAARQPRGREARRSRDRRRRWCSSAWCRWCSSAGASACCRSATTRRASLGVDVVRLRALVIARRDADDRERGRDLRRDRLGRADDSAHRPHAGRAEFRPPAAGLDAARRRPSC